MTTVDPFIRYVEVPPGQPVRIVLNPRRTDGVEVPHDPDDPAQQVPRYPRPGTTLGGVPL